LINVEERRETKTDREQWEEEDLEYCEAIVLLTTKEGEEAVACEK